MPAWRMALAAFLVFGLLGTLAYVIATSGDTNAGPPPTLVTTTSQTGATLVPVTVTIPTPTASSTTAAPGIVTSTSVTPPPVVIALNDALAAWGIFAVTGVMADLGDHFVVGGPQRRQLRSESAAIRENPLGPPAYDVTTANVFTKSVSNDDVVLRAEVLWERPGEEPQQMLWDIQMRLVDGRWLLHTVEAVEGG